MAPTGDERLLLLAFSLPHSVDLVAPRRLDHSRRALQDHLADQPRRRIGAGL